MENRLTIAVDVPDGLRSAEFPPMMLQSLVENSIRHGIEPKAEGGEVRVSATVLDGQLEVLVADTGVGLPSHGVSTTAGSGLGLSNVRERLDRFYPQGALLALEPLKAGGAQARIRIPYRVAGDATKQASQRGSEDRGPA
jgi:LytS/YehU family sensor histidine kinase